ncbi:VWA domain-containing protein [Nocardioides sp. OK12]|uniref:vWA domain-containing protein n=1 Tax=Nocardioides sp. OK12 TaxID=2758661 RepID=UPI0021C46139|nr:VWA domain-containing protein [Nocardioides sp. OK12]
MSLPDLRWPWVLPAVLVLLVLLLWWWGRARRRHAWDSPGVVLVAGVERLRRLPRYQSLLRRRLAAYAAVAVATLAVVAVAALLMARPQTIEVEQPDRRSRDIMLCLDASASMDDDNVAVVDEVRDIIGELPGDRIGLTLWSQTAVTVLPLTDDVDYVRAALESSREAFRTSDETFFGGVQLNSKGASLISDGIVSCTQRFDRPSQERTRIVLVSSDNDPKGDPVYTLPQAAAYAAEQDVVVYAVAAPELGEQARAEDRADFADAAATTGGFLALVGQDGATGEIVSRIDDLERRKVAEAPRQVRRDDPATAVRLASAALVVLLVAWVAQWVLLGMRLPTHSRRAGGES